MRHVDADQRLVEVIEAAGDAATTVRRRECMQRGPTQRSGGQSARTSSPTRL